MWWSTEDVNLPQVYSTDHALPREIRCLKRTAVSLTFALLHSLHYRLDRIGSIINPVCHHCELITKNYSATSRFFLIPPILVSLRVPKNESRVEGPLCTSRQHESVDEISKFRRFSTHGIGKQKAF